MKIQMLTNIQALVLWQRNMAEFYYKNQALQTEHIEPRFGSCPLPDYIAVNNNNKRKKDRSTVIIQEQCQTSLAPIWRQASLAPLLNYQESRIDICCNASKLNGVTHPQELQTRKKSLHNKSCEASYKMEARERLLLKLSTVKEWGKIQYKMLNAGSQE